MKINKQARSAAKSLFCACQVNGLLDESRVRQALDELLARKPRNYLAVLAHFQRLVKLDIERRNAVVESAVALGPDQQERMKSQLSAVHGPGLNFTFRANPDLLGGVRIRVGSDVYDGSIQGRLTELEESFKAA